MVEVIAVGTRVRATAVFRAQVDVPGDDPLHIDGHWGVIVGHQLNPLDADDETAIEWRQKGWRMQGTT